jgi:hypothetical protein
MSYSESPIDERYRLMLLEHYLDGAIEAALPNSSRKWQFICPFCSPLASKDYKKRQKKDCMAGKTLANLIGALNPVLGEAYRRERWHSGTTGKGHNCGNPQRS